MKKPNFLFVGADKAGSTWLFRLLRAHPACFVPAAKDIYFFDRHYERGSEWYASFFAHAPDDARAIGELSHDYLYSEEAAARIAADLPDVRILVFLRHPVERTFSEYLYLVRSGLIRGRSVRDALSVNREPIEHSRYARYLPSYLGRFPRENVGVFFYDQLVAAPATFAADVLAFLGVEPLVGYDYSERALAAARPRSAVLARAMKAAATRTRSAGFPTLVGTVKSSRLARALYATYPEDERPALDDADARWLHHQLDPDLHGLEALLGLPLAHWSLRG